MPAWCLSVTTKPTRGISSVALLDSTGRPFSFWRVMFDAANNADAKRKPAEDGLRRHVIVCPKCKLRSTFYKTIDVRIESSGFESCRVQCNICSSALAGILDPYDGTLLVSASPNDSGVS